MDAKKKEKFEKKAKEAKDKYDAEKEKLLAKRPAAATAKKDAKKPAKGKGK
jgi:hypothetical protein